MKTKKLPELKYTEGMTEQEIRSLQKQYQQRADAPYIEHEKKQREKRKKKIQDEIYRIGDNLEYSLNRIVGI
jgi:hypothetical protein